MMVHIILIYLRLNNVRFGLLCVVVILFKHIKVFEMYFI